MPNLPSSKREFKEIIFLSFSVLKDGDALDYDAEFPWGVQFVCCGEVAEQLVLNSAMLCCAR